MQLVLFISSDFLFFVSHTYKNAIQLGPTGMGEYLTAGPTSFVFNFFTWLAVSKGLVKH